MIGKADLERRFTNKLAECSETDYLEEQQKEVNGLANIQTNKEKEKAKEHHPVRRPSIRGDDAITNRLVHWSYSEGQKEEL
jgi:hypothetical protein